MPDGLAGAPAIVFPDGSVDFNPTQQQAGIPPGVGRSQVNIAAGNEAELTPYNGKRVLFIVECPTGGGPLLIGIGDATVTAADYSIELAGGQYYEADDEQAVNSFRALNNGPGPVQVRITEVTLATD